MCSRAELKDAAWEALGGLCGWCVGFCDCCGRRRREVSEGVVGVGGRSREGYEVDLASLGAGEAVGSCGRRGEVRGSQLTALMVSTACDDRVIALDIVPASRQCEAAPQPVGSRHLRRCGALPIQAMGEAR